MFHARVSAGSSPALLLTAHGSRDPRHAETVAAIRAGVAAALPEVRVEVAFLDFDAPTVGGALARLHGDGVRRAVAVPLLLSRAFHAKHDLPAVLAEAAAELPGLAVRQADVLGPDPLLLDGLERRLARTGSDAPRLGEERAETGVVLAAAGSTDPEANAVLVETAREWERTTGWCAVRPAFASAMPPRTADAVRALRADGARRLAVAPFVLAPGRLPDRILAGAAEAGAELVAPVLGAAPEVVRIVAARYAEASADAVSAAA